MAAIDFARSYMTWFGENEGSMSRIQLEAACTIIDETSGIEDTYYLIAPCRAEHTHSDDKLIVMPNYDFRGAYTTLVEDWMGMDPIPIVNGNFEKFSFIK